MAMSQTRIAALAIGALMIAGPAFAAPITFNMASGSSPLDGPDGNIRNFTASDGATTLSAQAWSLTGGGNTVFQSAYLGHYSGGLGVTNNQEGSGGGAGHTADNIGRQDLIVFQFSDAIQLDTVLLNAFVTASGGPDSDFSAWVGNNTGLPSLSGLNFANLDAGFTRLPDNNGPNAAQRVANIGAGPGTYTTFILAPSISDTSPEDAFKVGAIAGNTVSSTSSTGGSTSTSGGSTSTSGGSTSTSGGQVPEPAGLAFIGLGLLGAGLARRRRKTA